MATNTIYDVMNMSLIDKAKVNYNGVKRKEIVPPGETKNIDIIFSDDILLTGACFILTNSSSDDEIQIQIVHPNGITVLNQFIDWYAKDLDKDLPYPAKIPAGLIVRFVYKNTSEINSVTCRINYSTHKIIAVE